MTLLIIVSSMPNMVVLGWCTSNVMTMYGANVLLNKPSLQTNKQKSRYTFHFLSAFEIDVIQFNQPLADKNTNDA